MIRRLQTFAFNKSPYERPNQKWVCGRAAEGHPCRVGPDRRGRCRARAECRPRGEGEAWVCNRPPSAGGPCSDGPGPDGHCAHPIPPCQPVRSLRARRGLAARWVTALAVGLMVVVLYGPDAGRWLAPGGLSAPHTQVEDCGGCHRSFEGGPSQWLHAAFGGAPGPAEGDSQRCLGCHELGDQPLRPHGVPEARLAAADGEPQGGDAPQQAGMGPLGLELAGRLFPAAAGGDGLACATCHSEHQGHGADLTAMGDRRCQACHSEQFAAFTDGHPDFGNYPHQRRTRLNFDHVSHTRKHFPDADDPPERCVACHETDDRGRTMQVAGFETACASCHASDIHAEKAAGSPGIPVLTVPGLDLPSLRQADAGIGQWPAVSDRELTPFMRAVFAADPELAPALERFRELDPLDLRDASPADIEAVAKIAWATKGLLRDLIADGPATLRPALSRALGRDIGPGAARDLLGGMGMATVKRAQAAWFPDLASEVARHRAGEAVPMPAGEFDAPAATEAAPADADSGGSGEAILNDSGDSGGDSSEDGILGGGSQADEDGEAILGAGEDGGGDTGGDAGGGILSGQAEDGGGLLGGEDEGGEEGGGSEAADPAEAELSEPDPVEWGRLGGWYRDFFALLYRPGGHGDRFLKGWLDVAGRAMAGEGEASAAAIFRHLGAPDAPGRCTKCHSVDAGNGGALAVNWAAAAPRGERQGFTRFAHAPHFSVLSGDDGCAECHALDRDSDYQASFQDRNPTTFHANFRPIERDTCARCHVDERAGNDCTQCHNYHVGPVAEPATPTRLEALTRGGGEN